MEIRRHNAALAAREFALDARHGHLLLLESGTIHLAETGRVLSGGQLLWQPPGAPDALKIEAGSRSVRLALPRIELLRLAALDDAGGRLMPLLDLTLTAVVPASRIDAIRLLYDEIAGELVQPRPDSRIVCEAASVLLLTALLRLVQPDATEGARQPPLAEQFMLLAAQHWQEHRTVTAYAAALGVDRFRLGDAVKRQTGQTPQTYLNNLLMEKAKALLVQSGLRVSAVAYRLGFSDPAYFGRFFHRHAGQTPGAWRKARVGSGRESYAAWP